MLENVAGFAAEKFRFYRQRIIQWAELGIDGKGIGNLPPSIHDPVDLMPRLTLRMVARLEGFPDDWKFAGGKTASYRQIGNAFPPPVARTVATQLNLALTRKNTAYSLNADEKGQLVFMEAKALLIVFITSPCLSCVRALLKVKMTRPFNLWT